MTLREAERSRGKLETQPRSQRWLSLDVFRGLAILSMIQGHTFTVLLRPSELGDAVLPWYTLLHGLTAPMFLVGGGLAYGLVTLRSRADQAWNGASPRMLKRALMLLAIGYLLQLPKAPLSELWVRPELFEAVVKVGPLQLVGGCLLLLEGMRALSANRRSFLRLLTLSCLTICATAPFVWQLRASSRLPLPVGTWLDGYAGSLFPFFPWSAFFFGGVLVSAATQHAHASERKARRWAWVMTLSAGALAALAYAMFVHGYVLRSVYGDYELWHSSPLYVAFRAGLAFACLGLLWSIEPTLRRVWNRTIWIEPVFGTLSRQSLVAYVTHLLVLYGTPLTAGLIKLGTTLNLMEATLTFAFVLCLTTSISILWDHFITAGRLRESLRLVMRSMSVAAARQIDRIGER